MNTSIESILQKYRTLDFGPVPVKREFEPWRKKLNEEITILCRKLPKSQQAPALIFLMKYARISIGEELNIFKNYYPPSWTILCHLAADEGNGDVSNFPHHIRSLAMAMFLHSLEDHLTDEEIATSNLTLLIHGEAWHRYRRGLEEIEKEVEGGGEIIGHHLDDYFSSIDSGTVTATIGGYCDHFRKQMATWTLSTLLMKEVITREIPADELREAYESFGIAWRLLDDLNDLGDDIADGTRGACYYCLDEPWRQLYDLQEHPRDREELIKYMAAGGALEQVLELTAEHLRKGDDAARRAGIAGFGEELKILAAPIEAALARK